MKGHSWRDMWNVGDWPVASSAALQRHVRGWSTSRHGGDIVNVRLQPRHASLVGSGPRSSSGSLAMLATMRRQPLARRALSVPIGYFLTNILVGAGS